MTLHLLPTADLPGVDAAPPPGTPVAPLTAVARPSRLALVADRRSAPDDVADASTTDLTRLVRRPWRLRADGVTLTIRPSTSRDLPGVAAMHRRCSAHSLLDRYRAGGRAPAPLAIERLLRLPLSFVACRPDGAIMATAIARPSPAQGDAAAEIGILVEDGWQRIGIGRELMTHVAGAARVAGYTEMIAFPGESVTSAQRLMIDVGRTRMVPGQSGGYLRTALPEAAALGVGAVRERLVG